MRITPFGRTFLIVAAALAAAAAIGAWSRHAWQVRELRGAISDILRDAGGQMRKALSLDPGPTPESQLAHARAIEERVAAVERAIEQLKRLPLERDHALANSADGYLVALREILRRRAAASRLHVSHRESLRALLEHMRADDRSDEWARQAVRAKERAERDFRDYRLAVAAYGTLLDALPAAQKKIAPHAGPAALPDDRLIAAARSRALETARQADAEMEKARKLAASR